MYDAFYFHYFHYYLEPTQLLPRLDFVPRGDLYNSKVKSQKLKLKGNFIQLFISIRGWQNEIGGMLSKKNLKKEEKEEQNTSVF